MKEIIIEQKSCIHCQSSFDITDRDIEFYTKISPTFAGQKFQIPSPSLCPDCRQRRRLSFRNERNLYKRKCDASGKDVISIYSPDKPYTVYDQKIRWSDAWNPLDYGREFDFGKSFTENFKELLHDVPRLALQIENSDGSQYTNLSIGLKDCYLSYGCEYSSNVFYSSFVFHSDLVLDSYRVSGSSEIFNSFYIENSSKLQNCLNMQSSTHCIDCSDCVSCSYCLGCHGLENKVYYINNKQYTKDEYQDHLQKYQISWDLKSSTSGVYYNNEQVTGNWIYDSKHAKNCHFGSTAIDTKNISLFYDIQDAVDCNHVGFGSSRLYECECVVKTHNGFFSNVCRGPGSDIYYSDYCFGNIHCLFGCIGLRNKSYCIFNKQYTKEEYEKTVANIITHMIETGEWGDFFHPSLSPFGYNETVAMEYYPADFVGTQFFASSSRTDKSLSLQQLGYSRSTYQALSPAADKVINGQDLLATITEVNDDILKIAMRSNRKALSYHSSRTRILSQA